MIEDEPRIRALISGGLQAEGHAVSMAASVAETAEIPEGVDCVVLDLRLPDGDGAEVLEHLRTAARGVPVIILTAIDDEAAKVGALDAGADDYLTKPFSLAELSARIRARVRGRGAETAPALRTVGGLRFDAEALQAHSGDRTVALTAQESRLLGYFLRHPGQVLSRARLLNAVWGYGHDPGSNVVDVYVGYLRRKLALLGHAEAIATVRQVGYRFEPPDAAAAR